MIFHSKELSESDLRLKEVMRLERNITLTRQYPLQSQQENQRSERLYQPGFHSLEASDLRVSFRCTLDKTVRMRTR